MTYALRACKLAVTISREKKVVNMREQEEKMCVYRSFVFLPFDPFVIGEIEVKPHFLPSEISASKRNEEIEGVFLPM